MLELRQRASTAAKKCVSGRQLLIRIIAGDSLSEAERRAAIAANDGTEWALLRRWDGRDPLIRAAVLERLRAGELSYDALEGRLFRFTPAGKIPQEELVVVAGLYARPEKPYPECAKRNAFLRKPLATCTAAELATIAFDKRRRETCLRTFERERNAKSGQLAAARTALEKSLAGASGQERPVIALALVVLGDEARAPETLKAIPADGRIGNAGSEAQLVADWLERAPLHCARGEILAAARRAHAGEEVKTPFCKGLLSPGSRPSR